MTGIMTFGQLTGLSRMDMPMMLGTIFSPDPDRARVIGMIIHVLNGQVFALIYMAAFESLGWSSWWLGALFGIAHGLAALVIIVPILPGLHPRMASRREGPSSKAVLEPPGLMGLSYGAGTPVVTLVAHAVYGTILGAFIN